MHQEQVALQQIEQALNEGWGTLDLSGSGLTSAPDAIGRLTSLRQLRLQGNELSSLPEALGNLSNLRQLWLEHNELTSLPDSLCRLTNLRELYCRGNRLSSLPKGLGDLVNLREFSVTHNELLSVPTTLGQLRNLKKLWLSNNKLTSLPESLGDLSDLEELWLNDNLLSSLPESMGRLLKLQVLKLHDNRLDSVPTSLGQLANLQTLWLGNNLLKSLPDSLSGLSNLEELFLDINRLTSLPEYPDGFVNKSKLRVLSLANNGLTSVPEWMGNLANLEKLWLDKNRLTSVPKSLGNLKNLHLLWLAWNKLTSIPDSLGQLANLQELSLTDNQLRSIPASFGQLIRLQKLGLDDNPLPDPLVAAYQRGMDDFRAYLISLAQDEVDRLYEAKMVLVGEGDVGKTCLANAIAGREFIGGQLTTHGIEVRSLALIHPSVGAADNSPGLSPSVPAGTTLTLNTWDFGGQDVYRVTHQFFYSERSLYVIVWHPRRGVENSHVEDWIKHIERRVGRDIRILIVATHCESVDRVPRIDEHGLHARYPDLIAGFFEVDNKTGTGIAELRNAIVRQAARLPQMGGAIRRAWRNARDAVNRRSETRLSWSEFEQDCKVHGLAEEEPRMLVALMNDLGDLIHFRDDPSLRDTLILKPEWLSKAIGLVLEDRPTVTGNGILNHHRLDEIWNNPSRDTRDRYTEKGLYPFFLRLMEKFDVSYRIDENSSLVGQLVQQHKPGANIPWDHGSEPEPPLHRLQIIARIEEDPPGLVPWLIVRNHRYNTDKIHWTGGVFLKTEEYGNALVEMLDRDLFVTVHAKWPSTLIGMLQGSVTELLKTWKGLEGRYRFRVPCRNVLQNGYLCRGTFPLDALQEFKVRGQTQYPCETCYTMQDISILLDGFSGPDLVELIRQASEGIKLLGTQLDRGFDEVRQIVAQLMRQVRNMFANLQAPSPRLFTLLPVGNGRNVFDPVRWLKEAGFRTYRLTLWCEMPGHEHSCCTIGSTGSRGSAEKGEYVFDRPPEWLVTAAPYVSLIARVLGVVAPIVKLGVIKLADKVDRDEYEVWIEEMKALADAVTELRVESLPGTILEAQRLDPSRVLVESAEHRVFAELLRELDKSKHFGGLRWTFDKAAGDWLWVCPEHYRVFNPDLPVVSS